MSRRGEVTAAVDRSPDAVFAAITDVRDLAAWNERIVEVDTAPGELDVGDEWVVTMQLPGRRFRSRSTVLELDRAARRFVHRSAPDDDNPSHTVWAWQVEPGGTGATVTLAWDLRPRTPLRHLAALLRSRMIPDEARASIDALAARC